MKKENSYNSIQQNENRSKDQETTQRPCTESLWKTGERLYGQADEGNDFENDACCGEGSSAQRRNAPVEETDNFFSDREAFFDVDEEDFDEEDIDEDDDESYHPEDETRSKRGADE